MNRFRKLLIIWLIDWPIDWWIEGLIDWLIDWLIFCRPTPEITWKKNGQPITREHNSIGIRLAFYGRSLYLAKANRTLHQDRYTCEAESSLYTGRPLIYTIKLLVDGKSVVIGTVPNEGIFKSEKYLGFFSVVLFYYRGFVYFIVYWAWRKRTFGPSQWCSK